MKCIVFLALIALSCAAEYGLYQPRIGQGYGYVSPFERFFHTLGQKQVPYGFQYESEMPYSYNYQNQYPLGQSYYGKQQQYPVGHSFYGQHYQYPLGEYYYGHQYNPISGVRQIPFNPLSRYQLPYYQQLYKGFEGSYPQYPFSQYHEYPYGHQFYGKGYEVPAY